MSGQNSSKYGGLGEKEIRLFKLDLAEPDVPLSGKLVTFRHPCHYEVNWKNYAGMFRNWHDMRLTERSGDDYGYDALSYAWGSPESLFPLTLLTTEKVYIKGKLKVDGNDRQQGIVYIRKNLNALLQQLRRIHYDRFIWIDSICIDQGNDDEKSTQIALMKHIYKEAKTVLIWLGDASAVEEGALTLMPAIARILKQAAAEGPEIRLELPETFEMIGLPPPSHSIWPALGTLMNRDWFRRLWTLQEVVLPEKTRLLCGKREIGWEAFADFSAIVASTYKQRIINWTITGDPQIETTELHGYDAVRVVNYCRQSLATNQWGVPLSTLLCATRRRQAANPVDMIFGMLGMAAPGLLKELAINVSAPPRDVYLTFARYYIRHEVNECLLNHTGPPTDFGALPSWCPNFGSPAKICSLGSRWWNDCIVEETAKSQNYRAGFTESGRWSIPIIDHYLRSSMGAVFRLKTLTQDFYDTLDPRQISLTPSINHIRASGMVLDVISQIVPCNTGAHDFLIDLASTQRTWKWETLCLALAKQTLGDGAEIPAVYWRTLIANQTGGKLGEENIIWDRFDRIDMLEYYHLWKLWMKKVIHNGKISSFFNDTEYRTRWFGTQVSRVTQGRCFFVTTNGRIGLGPAHMQVGDTVCVFFYCPTPYVLRSGPSVHKFIGEAYVHGLMYSQTLDMLDQGLVEETQFTIG